MSIKKPTVVTILYEVILFLNLIFFWFVCLYFSFVNDISFLDKLKLVLFIF